MSPKIFRPAPIVLCVAICCLAVLSLAALRPAEAQTRPASTGARHETLLIFPFENESRMANLDWLGEGVSELTAERLEDRHFYVLSRLDRLSTLEHMGLPDSARFSHASMVKIATDADADAIIYGRFQSDGKTLALEARLLRLSPPSLSPPLTETGNYTDLIRLQARLTWQILCALDQKNCLAQGANRDESSFSEPPPTLHAEALQSLVKGIGASEDEERLRLLRDASRLEPAWDRPAFELGQIYFSRRDCDQALQWYSHVPANRPDGPEAAFAAGVCDLSRNDDARAEASFSGLIERTKNPAAADSLPDMPEVHNNLGVARFLLGKPGEAVAEFERATALDPGEPDYHVNLGLARLASKQAASAAGEFEQASKIDPDDKQAKTLLIATLESLGRPSEAAALRAGSAAGEDKVPSPNLQDAAALARMARVSRALDRALLRPTIESAESQPTAKDVHKKDSAKSRQ